jgi:hypothetical protein
LKPNEENDHFTQEIDGLRTRAERAEAALAKQLGCSREDLAAAFELGDSDKDVRGDVDCEGPGRCHGTLAWCDICGDVRGLLGDRPNPIMALADPPSDRATMRATSALAPEPTPGARPT